MITQSSLFFLAVGEHSSSSSAPVLLVLPCLHLICVNAYEGYHQPPDRSRPNKTRLLFAHSTFRYPMTRKKEIDEISRWRRQQRHPSNGWSNACFMRWLNDPMDSLKAMRRLEGNTLVLPGECFFSLITHMCTYTISRHKIMRMEIPDLIR